MALGIFVVMGMASLAPAQAYASKTMDWDFTDDFEGIEQSLDIYDSNYEVTTIPVDSTITIDEHVNYSGSSSMKLYNDRYALYGYTYATRPIPELTNGTFKYATMVDDDTHIITQLWLMNPSYDKFGIILGFMQDPKFLSGQNAIYYYNQTTMVDSGLDFQPNVWYEITLTFDTPTTTFSAWINGGGFEDDIICNNMLFYDAATWGTENIGSFQLMGYIPQGGDSTTAWYDEIRYGKEPIPTPPETPINIPKTVNVPLATIPPDVDGEIDLDEYKNGAYMEFKMGSKCGAEDNSVVIYSVYDSHNLYIGIDVLFDESQNDGKEGDQVILMLDLDNDNLLNDTTDAGFFLDTDNLQFQGIADGDGTYGFNPTNRSGNNHRIWEFSVDRDILPDVKVKFGVFIYGIANICESDVDGYAYPPQAMNDTGLPDLSESNVNVSNFGEWRLTSQPSKSPSQDNDGDHANAGDINTTSPVLLGSVGTMGVSGAVIASRQSVMAITAKMVAFSTFSVSSAVFVVGLVAGWFIK
jgi:hypothetical protein